jgi:hypothetical protein
MPWPEVISPNLDTAALHVGRPVRGVRDHQLGQSLVDSLIDLIVLVLISPFLVSQ